MNFNFFRSRKPPTDQAEIDLSSDKILTDDDVSDELEEEFGDDEVDDEEEIEKLEEELHAAFMASPEGAARLAVDPEMGFWSRQFLEYGSGYLGRAPADMALNDVQELVSEIFPRKISVMSREEAEDGIPELIAFWQFLGREHGLRQAKAILNYLHQVQPQFSHWMLDPARAGMAKSFFMQGHAAGYDMTDTQQANRFIAEYNAHLLTQSPPDFGELDDFSSTGLRRISANPSKANVVKKKARKMAKASRKANRKKRK